MGRAPCCDKANVKKGPWSPEEDAKLKAYIEEHGTGGNWIALPQKIGLKRCGKSCRLRWLNYLRPNIKHGGFSEEEDQIICSLYISIGSRWSIIAAQLPGRTDNDIKNYWNTRLKKKLLGKRRDSSRSGCLSINQQPNEKTNGTSLETSSQALSPTALERMQLHMELQGLNVDPFSFYNNPAPWSKFHPSSDKLYHVQRTDSSAIVATPVQQATDHTTMTKPSGQNVLPIKPHMPISPMSSRMQVDLKSSAFGFPSPSSSSALSMENSNSVFDAATVGLQDELRDLLYRKNAGCFGWQEEQRQTELDCFFNNTNGKKERMDWLATNDFGEKSSSGSWDTAYELGYDL